MKKTYMQPQAVICEVKVESVLETTSISTGEPLTEGVFEGATKDYLFDDFDFE